MEPGHRARYVGRELAYGPPEDMGAPDGFDKWVQARETLQARDLPATRTPGAPPGLAVGAATGPRSNAVPDSAARARREAARQAQHARAQQRKEAELRAQAQRRELSARQQKEQSERWRREQEEWLRWQEGGPPPQSNGIPARRIS
jgi:hypothetical protein